MLKAAPDPVDVQDLQFKLHCRIKVFNNTESASFAQPCSLVTCASRFGLIFIGTHTSNIQVIQLKHLEDYSKGDGDKCDYPRRNFAVPSPPTHISVNCEHTVLAVIITKNNTPCALFYDVKSFWRQDVVQLGEIRLSATPNVHVVEVNWNPTVAPVFTACKSDGSLGIYQVQNSGIDINELPAASGATCFSWSPKGKQIAVGSRDGKITQYKPDLKAVKVINAPPLKEPHSLQNLQWVSNYQFVGVFQPTTSNDGCSFIVVDAPKTGEHTYINYYDICYSNGSVRPVQFYTILLQNWNILMAASSNSMEVGILGSVKDSWTQWIMGDAARAELPLSSSHQETLPVGFAVDIGCTKALQWGEVSLPPAPLLLLLSHHGTLCCFNVVNLKQGLPSICTPPDPISDTSGLHNFVTNVQAAVKPKEVASVTAQPQFNLTSDAQNTLSAVAPQQQFHFTSDAQVKPQEIAKTTSQFQLIASDEQSVLKPKEVEKSQQQQAPISFFKAQPAPISLFGGQATLTPLTPPNKTTPPTTPSQQSTAQVVPAKTTPTKEELQSELDSKVDEEAEQIFAQMVRDECAYLESEVRVALHQGRALQLNLGTDDDKTRIVATTQSLDDFFKELVETCTTINSEVHVLKQNLLQSMAWYEEAKSRHSAFEDESMLMLIRAQPLDSASEKQIQDIRHMNYYLESQMAQAHMALDEQWDNFQDYCKKTHKLQIPTMEMIFQTMVKQNAILQKQSYVLKDIANRIKKKSRSALGPPLLIAVDHAQDLPDELKRLRLDTEDIRHILYERVLKRKLNLTQAKCDSLKALLKNREYSRVAAVKPQLSSTIIQASPSLKLGASTPKTPTTFKRALVQSTPIEGLQKFALGFESNSIITGSPNSAFVSTSSTLSFKQPVVTSSSTATFNFNKPFAIGSLPQPMMKTSTATTRPSNFNASFTTTAPNLSFATMTPSSPFGGSKLFSFATNTPTITTTATSSVSPGFGVPKTTANLSAPSSALNLSTAKTSMFGGVSTTTSPFFSSTTATTNSAVSSSISSSTSLSGLLSGQLSMTAVSNKFGPTTQTSSTTFTNFKPTDSSVFGNVATGANSVGSFFGNTKFGSATTASTKPSVFNNAEIGTVSAQPSEISTATTKPLFSVVETASTKPSIFSGSETSTASIKPLVFGSTETSSSPATKPFFGNTETSVASSASSIFGSTSSSKPQFGNETIITSGKQFFGSTGINTSSAKLLFGSTAPSTATSKPFGTAETSTTSTKPLFGSSDTSATSTKPFGSTDTSATSTKPFGSTDTSATPTKPFGSTDTSATPTKPLFGPEISITAIKPTLFGGTETRTPLTEPSIFNAAEATKPSVFVTSSTKPSIFASTELNIPTVKPSSSIFGAASANVSTKPLFGGTDTSTASTAPSIFSGADTSAALAKQSVFSSAETSVKPSLFGSIEISSSNTKPLFGGTDTSTASAKSSAFGSTETSTASTKPTTFHGGDVTSTTSTATAKPSIFGANAASTASTAFGGTQPSATAAKPSIFGGGEAFKTPDKPSVFGSGDVNAKSSPFGQAPATTSSGLFGASPATQTSSIFGSAPAATTSFGFGAFGSATSTSTGGFGAVTTTQSVFGNVSSTSTTPFGGAIPSTQPSIFGNVPSTAATTAFGSPASPSQPTAFGAATQPSVFAPATCQSQTPIFGSAAPTGLFSGAAKSTIFGSPATTTQSSIFGGANQPSIFGAPTTSTSFGQSQSAFAQSPAFGASGSSFGSTGVFGGSTKFGQTPSVFGAPTSTSGNIFGATPTTNTAFGSSGSVFGSPASSTTSVFGSSNAFSSSTQSSTGGFGFGGLNVGSTPATSSAGFGSATPAANPFGSSSFGSSGTSIFGSGSSQSAGFGQSTFGQQSAFGQSTFGAGFGQQQPSGPFSGGGGTVAQSGFGASSTFQKAQGGFGSGPVFGGTPAFGSAPSFGSAPAFGSQPGFGSPPKVFGAGDSTGFGAAPGAQSPGFGNLANQPTVGFGNLAQQATNTPTSNTPFSGNSSFSSWR